MATKQQKQATAISQIIEGVAKVIRDTAPPPPIEKRLFNISEAGHYLGRSKRGMEALVADGKIGSVQHDKRRFFDRVELDSWIDAGKVA